MNRNYSNRVIFALAFMLITFFSVGCGAKEFVSRSGKAAAVISSDAVTQSRDGDEKQDKSWCAELSLDDFVTYESDIAPLMEANCNSCHSGESAAAGYRTDRYGEGDSDDIARHWGEAVARVSAKTMPPFDLLGAASEQLLRDWQKQGFLQDGEENEALAACEESTPASPAKSFDRVCDPNEEFQPDQVRVWRLSHAAYDHTIADLLGIDPGASESFEKETGGKGSKELRVNLTQATLYQRQAEAIARAATEDLSGLLGCDANPPSDSCVLTFISAFGLKAWRQPIPSDTRERLFALYDKGRSETDVRTGIQLVLEALMQSPQLLYRYELGADDRESGKVALTHYEMATQLSYYLTGSTPDAELLEAAAEQNLGTTDQLLAHAERLLATERGKNHFADFFLHLMAIDTIEDVTKDAETFPMYSSTLARHMKGELRNFAKHVTWSDGGKLDTLLTAPYTFVNRPLAQLYGVSYPADQSGYIKADLDPSERAGILTQLGLLTAMAEDSESSPLHRGLFVRQRLLCQQLPAPPQAAVDLGVPPPDPTITTRERFARHSQDPNCASCHKLIDPIGFSMENYDAIGRYRTTEHGLMIDNAGELLGTYDVDGIYSGAVELANRLADSEQVEECVAVQYFTHAMGREVREQDSCGIATLHDGLSSPANQLLSMILSVIKTDAFKYRTK